MKIIIVNGQPIAVQEPAKPSPILSEDIEDVEFEDIKD